ncbi:hypothetical protein [Coleofasciculus sp. FACHB-125]|nr:hypothetical protein [Coleofasciculus sp. FACHB-125]
MKPNLPIGVKILGKDEGGRGNEKVLYSIFYPSSSLLYPAKGFSF